MLSVGAALYRMSRWTEAVDPLDKTIGTATTLVNNPENAPAASLVLLWCHTFKALALQKGNKPLESSWHEATNLAAKMSDMGYQSAELIPQHAHLDDSRRRRHPPAPVGPDQTSLGPRTTSHPILRSIRPPHASRCQYA